MNSLKGTDADYINFFIAPPKQLTATETARAQPASKDAPAHDAFTRLLTRLEPAAETLWLETHPQVDVASGVFVLDDLTLDKPFSKSNPLVIAA